MKIQSFSAHQFRNFKDINPVEFPEAPLLAILAPNASGKTNFLEAIVVMLRGKSFRAQMKDLVMWGEDSFVIRGDVEHAGENSLLAIEYKAQLKNLRIEENSIPVSPVTFFGRYPFVLFLPEDTFLFNRGPAGRRNFMNTSLASSQKYLANIVQYHRVLRQRNAALKTAQSIDDIAVWTQLLVLHAQDVWAHRQAFISYLGARVSAIYEDLFSEKLDISISFIPGASHVESFQELLFDAWKYEKRYRYTMYGPHRDDFVAHVNGKVAEDAMSRGQLRGLVIAIKVVAYGYIKQLTGYDPLLLFDEVLSELDAVRQKNLLAHLPATQTILTCTTIPDEVKKRSDVFVLDVRPLTQINS
ncbi:MAG: DNA replication and repair protein RecF [bacterium]|nr:DNA replication and repair protein RecF [bacterium]